MDEDNYCGFQFPDGFPAEIEKVHDEMGMGLIYEAAFEYYNRVDDDQLMRIFKMPETLQDVRNEMVQSLQGIQAEHLLAISKFRELCAMHKQCTILAETCKSPSEKKALLMLRGEAIHTFNGIMKSINLVTFNAYNSRDVIMRYFDEMQLAEKKWQRKACQRIKQILELTEPNEIPTSHVQQSA